MVLSLLHNKCLGRAISMWVHRSASGDQHLPQEAEPGPTTTAHPPFMPQDSRTRLTHCPHEWSQPSVVKCGYPMFKNSEVSSDFWDIPKDPRTTSPSLKLLQLFLEINILLLAPRGTAQRVCCPEPGVAFSEKKLNSTLLPFCNSLLRQASMNSLRGMLIDTAPWQTQTMHTLLLWGPGTCRTFLNMPQMCTVLVLSW